MSNLIILDRERERRRPDTAFEELVFARAAVLQQDLANELERCPKHEVPRAVCAEIHDREDAAVARGEAEQLRLDLRPTPYDPGTASRHGGG